MKRWLPFVLILVLLLCTLSGCTFRTQEPEQDIEQEESQEKEEEKESAELKPTPRPVPEPEEDLIYSPLTGLPVEEDVSANRPYAVMINNISVALPQHGISQADMIFEMKVEGGITRMLAVYEDFEDAPVLGSIRSSRPYYLDLAMALDAIYVHAGGSDTAYSLMSSYDIDHIDGLSDAGNAFYRDADRRASMGLEHSLMIDTQELLAYVQESDLRTEHETGYAVDLSFADTSSAAGGKTAQNMTVAFSGGKETSFAYNATEGLYAVSQYGDPCMDAENDEQVAVKNVLVLFAPFSQISGDDKGRLQADLTGSGTGYYAADGKYVEINWTRESVSSQFVLTLADGTDLQLGRGVSYICIVPQSSTIDFQSQD